MSIADFSIWVLNCYTNLQMQTKVINILLLARFSTHWNLRTYENKTSVFIFIQIKTSRYVVIFISLRISKITTTYQHHKTMSDYTDPAWDEYLSTGVDPTGGELEDSSESEE